MCLIILQSCSIRFGEGFLVLVIFWVSKLFCLGRQKIWICLKFIFYKIRKWEYFQIILFFNVCAFQKVVVFIVRNLLAILVISILGCLRSFLWVQLLVVFFFFSFRRCFFRMEFQNSVKIFLVIVAQFLFLGKIVFLEGRVGYCYRFVWSRGRQELSFSWVIKVWNRVWMEFMRVVQFRIWSGVQVRQIFRVFVFLQIELFVGLFRRFGQVSCG